MGRHPYLILLGGERLTKNSDLGEISDDTGRRPACTLCFIIYKGAYIGLVMQNSYVALLVSRMLQNSESSEPVALAYAMIADVIPSAEMGSYIGYTSIRSMLGPSLGPIIDGLLSQYLGWKAVFWLLTVLSGLFHTPLLVAFPGT